MKKIFVLGIALLLACAGAFAQKYAVIDSRYIFEKMPDYKRVQQQIDAQAAAWQKEIDAKQAELDKLYNDYDAEQAMMSEDLKKKKRRRII